MHGKTWEFDTVLCGSRAENTKTEGAQTGSNEKMYFNMHVINMIKLTKTMT